MELETEIIKNVEYLLKSAKDRKIDQGRLVCEKTIESLQMAKSKLDIEKLLKKFNRVYSGIEAHGSLTAEEFQIIKELRKLENHEQ